MQAATDSSRGTRQTILLIEEDDDTHPALKTNLRKAGYRVLLAVCIEDANDWLDGVYVHADLVLVDLVGKSTNDMLNEGQHLRRHARYEGDTPLVLLAEEYGKDVEGTDVNVGGNDWVSYLGEDFDQLHNLIRLLLQSQSEAKEAPLI